MIKVKLSIPGFGDNLNISQYVGNKENIFQNCCFYVNDPNILEVDYWFIFDDLQYPEEKAVLPPENIYFVTAEVVHKFGYYDSPSKTIFLNQFHNLITCFDIFNENASFDLPFLGWMINANHGISIFSDSDRDLTWFKNLKKIEKTKTLSVFCSSKVITPEHNVRLKFVKKLKNHFGENIDWYGNGINSLSQKWEGIAPYKYHIVLENQSRNNIITEKLYDSFLGLAYPFYWGAPNVSDYFSPNSFTPIEILDWKNAINIIEKTMDEDNYNSKIPYLVESKNKTLTTFNPYQRILNIIKESKKSLSQKQSITLFSSREVRRQKVGIINRIQDKLGDFLFKIASKIQNNI